jgi:uncharacterized protein YjlB
LAFEDGSVQKLEAGDSAFIPGGYIHNETDASNDFDVLEISIPAKLETVAVDAPAGLE